MSHISYTNLFGYNLGYIKIGNNNKRFVASLESDPLQVKGPIGFKSAHRVLARLAKV